MYNIHVYPYGIVNIHVYPYEILIRSKKITDSRRTKINQKQKQNTSMSGYNIGHIKNVVNVRQFIPGNVELCLGNSLDLKVRNFRPLADRDKLGDALKSVCHVTTINGEGDRTMYEWTGSIALPDESNPAIRAEEHIKYIINPSEII